MKMKDYKRTLDEVKCSDEFREKMENMLSQPAVKMPEGYEDSVDTVDIAPKIHWTKYASIAAAAVLVIGGAGGGAYYHFANMDSVEEENVVQIVTPFGNTESMEANIITYRSGEKEEIIDLGKFPEIVTKDIAQYLCSKEWEEFSFDERPTEVTSENQAGLSEYTNIILQGSGEESFELLTSSSTDFNDVVSVTFFKNSESKNYVAKDGADVYNDIYKIIEKDLIYCDLSNVGMTLYHENDFFFADMEMAEKLNGILKKYLPTAEPIENGTDLATTEWIDIALGERYAMRVVKDNTLSIGNNHYKINGDIYGELIGLFDEIHGKNASSNAPWADKGWNAETTLSYYPNGEYQTYLLTEKNPLKDYLEALDWSNPYVPENREERVCSGDNISITAGSCIIDLYQNGWVMYESGSVPDIYDSVTYYQFTEQDYANMLSLLEEWADSHEFDNDSTDLVSVMRNSINDKTACSYVSEEFPRGKWVSFRMDEGTIDKFISIFDDIEMNNAEYPAYDNDIYMTTHFNIGQIVFTEDGGIYDETNQLAYHVEKDQISSYFDFLKEAMCYNEESKMQYRMLVPENSYKSMSADIEAEYNVYVSESEDDVINGTEKVYSTGGKGTITYKPSSGDQDIKLTDKETGAKIKLVKENGSGTYTESGANELNIDLTDPHAYVELDYDNIRDAAFKALNAGAVSVDYPVALLLGDNYISFVCECIVDENITEDYHIIFDTKYNTLVDFSMIRTDKSTSEILSEQSFTIGDGFGGDITYK